MTTALALATVDTFRNQIIQADALTLCASLPPGSVHCIVTSPPYFGLRDYGADGQIGLEDTPEAYIDRLVTLFREARRVLREDGTFWLNLGDSYGRGTRGKNEWSHLKKRGITINENLISAVLPEKNLLGIPWRVALALQADGWILRSDIIWAKKNPMPESVTDRPTKAHEYVFLFAKSPRYFYDADAIKERAIGDVTGGFSERVHGARRATISGGTPQDVRGQSWDYRNKRSVWTVATQPYSEAHFATFPPKLIEPMIKAGCPRVVCEKCGAPVVRVTEKGFTSHDATTESQYQKGTSANRLALLRQAARSSGGEYVNQRKTLGYKPSCDCGAGTSPGIVLDPFMGAGTVGLVARRLGRDYIGSDLNAKYVEMAQKRIDQEDPTKPKVLTTGETQLSLFEGATI